MKLPEFIRLYVPELHDKKSAVKDASQDILPYDNIVEDISGKKIKIVYSGTGREEIPIDDILSYNLEYFRIAHPSDAAFETYTNYRKLIEESDDFTNEAYLFFARQRDDTKADEQLWKDFLL